MSGLIPKDEYIDVIAATTGALKDESLRNRFIALGFEYITLRVEHDRATPPRAEVDVEIARLRGVLQAIEGVSSSAIIRSMAHEALSTPTPTDAREEGGV